MHVPFYPDISVSRDKSLYEFVSIGKRGKIHKVVQFSELLDYYNIALGDKLSNGTFDFDAVTDNGDLPQIIATVVQIIVKYTDYFPEKTLAIYGSDEVRMKLYGRAIRNSFNEFNMLFDIWGIREDFVKEVFNPKESYFGFLIKRK